MVLEEEIEAVSLDRWFLKMESPSLLNIQLPRGLVPNQGMSFLSPAAKFLPSNQSCLNEPCGVIHL